MKNIIVFMGCLLFVINASGQQEENVLMFHKQMHVFNPAYAGSNNNGANFFGSFRSQWVGVKDAPEHRNFSFDTPLGKQLGLGVSVSDDRVFIEKRTSVNLDFSYKIQLSSRINLFMGARGSVELFNIELSRLHDANDLDYTGVSDQNNKALNIGAGLYLLHDSFYLSFAVPRLLATKRIAVEDAKATIASTRLHSYMSGGYAFELSSSFKMQPRFLMRYVEDAPFAADVLLGLDYNDRIELGASISTNELFGGFFTVKLQDFAEFGYSYGNTTNSDLSLVSKSIHEAYLRFFL